MSFYSFCFVSYRALSLDLNNLEVLLMTGQYYYNVQQYQTSLRIYKHLITIHPFHPKAVVQYVSILA